MIKRLIVAAAGYALYRWWNSEAAKPEPVVPVKALPARRKPVRPA